MKDNFKNSEKLAKLREKLAFAQNRIAIGSHHSVGIKPDGMVLAVGNNRFYSASFGTLIRVIT